MVTKQQIAQAISKAVDADIYPHMRLSDEGANNAAQAVMDIIQNNLNNLIRESE